MDAEPLLRVRDLTIAFKAAGGWSRVVEDVDFDIGRAETLALVGESGSGKSVTALSVVGLNPTRFSHTEGEVGFCGEDLLKKTPQQMTQLRGNEISMIFQEPMTSLNPVMTIGRQISEAIFAHRRTSRAECRREALALLEKVRIPAARSRFGDYPDQFSGGMRQRVMIAMALAGRPKLLIADEPTTALDVTVQAQILDLIRQLQRDENMSVLFITHDMGVVAEMADRVVVMYRGRAVETGTTEGVFAAPAHGYTRSLLETVPRLGSMKGVALPKPFPIVDAESGAVTAAPHHPDTVDRQSAPILAVRNLCTRFNVRTGVLGRVTARIHAVEDVSFELRRGETLALVGESGCGKSTLGRSVLRLVKPSGGSVRLDDTELTDMPRSRLGPVRRNAQIVFQDPFASLNPRISVGRTIAEPLVVHGVGTPQERRERVARLLETVGLSADMSDRFPHEFSGGQRQRICIARALALEPDLIVADEAVSALDVSIKAQIINLMLDLQARLGLSYLFISHDMAVVERISHRIAVMYLGRIVEIGSREAIIADPQHPYTRQLIEAVPIVDPARRHAQRPLPISEIESPIRPVGYVPTESKWHEASPGHLVLKH